MNKRLKIILIVCTVLLLIPLIAMQFSNNVNWSLFDFGVAGILLFGTGLTIEFILRKVKSTKNRVLITVALLVIVLLFWIELAVGVFGTPFAGT